MTEEFVPLSQLRQLIDNACNEGVEDLSLRRFLAQRAGSLHPGIGIQAGDPVEQLHQFVEAYIQQVPILLDDFRRIAIAAGVERELEAFINIAVSYFLQPLDITAEHKGLLKLMDAAYLAHRLIEEVNDRFLGNTGVPLASVDNTEANVVMHFLIGEKLANELDVAVHYSVEMLISQNALFRKESLLRYVAAKKQRQQQMREQGETPQQPVRLSLDG
ncbi:MAG: hypothetical protein OIF35_05760 [Cellvibrionaceae bacterium]|nr:hypothetical protein [Cellvibrionaceae bacterium]MCV6624487.1 hypothetical protein [Cellvibrionaceae bacterium]